jgi:hypothetical protein
MASSGYMRLQNGWGALGSRGYMRSAEWVPRDITSEGSFAEISIYTPSGVLMGKIRSDCQNSIIEKIEFTIDNHGCANFKLELNALPPFPMLPFSLITFKIGNTRYNWYSGEISYKDDEGLSNEDGYEFSGVGLRSYLKTLKAKTTYNAGDDVGAVVKDLVETWIAPYCAITYNASKIDDSTGVILASNIELSSHPIETVLDTLASMAGCEWGVDGDRDLYFLPSSTAIKKTFFIGYNINTFKPKWNLTEVKNVITVQRQEGAGSGGVGWAVAGVYNDASSVKKYGRKELNFQIPGYFGDDEADVIGNALLAEKKEPAMSAQITGHLVYGGNEFLQRGNYRFVLPFGEYHEIWDDCDDASLWNSSLPGVSTISKDSNFYIYGDGSIKTVLDIDLPVHTPCNYITKLHAVGQVKTLNFYIASSVTGNFYAWLFDSVFGYFKEYSFSIPTANKFYNIAIDMTTYDSLDICYFGVGAAFIIPAGSSIWIDRLEMSTMMHKHYTLKLDNAKYIFSPTDQSASAEFGKIPPKMENYLAGLFSTATELKFTQEIR